MALDIWEAAGRRGVVALPTGSRKTVVALGASATAAKSALCLVPTWVLLHQWLDKLAEHHPVDRFGREACWNVLQARLIMCLLFEYAVTLGPRGCRLHVTDPGKGPGLDETEHIQQLCLRGG